jgi:hypothetical protein
VLFSASYVEKRQKDAPELPSKSLERLIENLFLVFRENGSSHAPWVVHVMMVVMDVERGYPHREVIFKTYPDGLCNPSAGKTCVLKSTVA